MVFEPGTLQVEDELPNKVTWQNDVAAKPSTQLTPLIFAISTLYTPCLSVVLLTENVVCSVIWGEFVLNLHRI